MHTESKINIVERLIKEGYISHTEGLILLDNNKTNDRTRNKQGIHYPTERDKIVSYFESEETGY